MVGLEDLQADALVRVPKGVDAARPGTEYLLHIYTVKTWPSGAVQLTGEVRRLDGSPSALRHKLRDLTTRPELLEPAAVARASLAPTTFGIAWVLRAAGFSAAARLAGPGPGGQARAGFHVADAGARGVAVTWQPGSGQPSSPPEAQGMLAGYAEAIAAAGWRVESGGSGVTVRARQDR